MRGAKGFESRAASGALGRKVSVTGNYAVKVGTSREPGVRRRGNLTWDTAAVWPRGGARRVAVPAVTVAEGGLVA